MKLESGALLCSACGDGFHGGEEVIDGIDRLHSVPGDFRVIICAHCGSGTTTPVIPGDSFYALYPSDYNAYALPEGRALAAAATGLFHWRFARALRRHPLQSADRRFPRILDVGGGRGDLAVMLSRHGAAVTVLDPSSPACTTARARGVRAIEGTLESLTLPRDERFDALVFQHSLEHVASPFETLETARGCIEPGGSLLITLPNFGSQSRQRFGTYWFHLDLPRHRTHFTEHGLREALERAGFGEIECTTSTSPDGFAMSEYYRRNGRAPRTTARRLTTAFAGITTSPLVSALTRDGDTLHASCRVLP